MYFDLWIISGVCVTISVAQDRTVTMKDDSKVSSCDPDVPSRLIPVVADHEESQSSRLVCKEGEFLDWYKCSPCEEGTFRTRMMAKLDRLYMCQKCQEPGMYEIVREPCTRNRDAKIMCEDGFYRNEVPGHPCESSCVRCDICGVRRNMFKPFEARECGGYQNTVCCKKDYMIVVDGQCLEPTSTTHKASAVNIESATPRHELLSDVNDEPMNINGFERNVGFHPKWLLVKLVFLVIVLMLYCQELNARNSDVRCDPDVPSRPQLDVIFHAIALPQSDIQVTSCPGGEYLDWYKCSPCEEGTFRTKLMAALDKYSWCQKCQEPGMYEIIKEPCTKSRDTMIMCEDGFYRFEVLGTPCKSECVRCDICGVGRNMFFNFEARECGGYSNTVCCEHDDMVVKDGQCVPITTSTREKTTSTTTTSSVRHNTEALTAYFVGQSAIHKISNCLWIICLVTFVLCTYNLECIIKGG